MIYEGEKRKEKREKRGIGWVMDEMVKARTEHCAVCKDTLKWTRYLQLLNVSCIRFRPEAVCHDF